MYQKITNQNRSAIQSRSTIAYYPIEGDIKSEFDKNDEDNISWFRVDYLSSNGTVGVTPLPMAKNINSKLVINLVNRVEINAMIEGECWWISY